jgi:hypothetical protein
MTRLNVDEREERREVRAILARSRRKAGIDGVPGHRRRESEAIIMIDLLAPLPGTRRGGCVSDVLGVPDHP